MGFVNSRPQAVIALPPATRPARPPKSPKPAQSVGHAPDFEGLAYSKFQNLRRRPQQCLQCYPKILFHLSTNIPRAYTNDLAPRLLLLRAIVKGCCQLYRPPHLQRFSFILEGHRRSRWSPSFVKGRCRLQRNARVTATSSGCASYLVSPSCLNNLLILTTM